MKNYDAFVKLAQQGDSAACQALYEDTIDSVHFIISRLVDRAEDVEDLVQDTYLTAFSHLDQLAQPQAFPKWIHNIAANLAKNYLKKHKPVLFSTDEEEERMLNSIPAVGEDFLPEEYARKKELRSRLMEAINTLPEKQKTAVYLYYYEDMSVKELSEILEVGENTVKSRLNAGRSGIRNALQKMGITSSALAVLALAMRAEAAEYEVPVANRNAIWSGIQSGMAVGGGSSSGGSSSGGSSAGSSAAKAAGATAAKAGFLTTVAGKITAAVVAVAVLAGGAIAIGQGGKDKPVEEAPAGQVQEVVQDETQWVSKYGIPEEMRSIEDAIDQEGIEGWEDVLELVSRDFGETIGIYEFEDYIRIERYADGYAKFYIFPALTDQLPVDEDHSYDLLFMDASGEIVSGMGHSESDGSYSYGNDELQSVMQKNEDFVVMYTKQYREEYKEPVRVEIREHTSSGEAVMMTLTREATEIVEEPTEEATEEVTEATEPEGTYVTTEALDVAGCNLQEVFAVMGQYFAADGNYWFKDSSLGYVFAYGEENGTNYIFGSLANILKNAPETMTVEELQQYFPGGYEFYDEMDSRDCYGWDYNGCTLVIFKGLDGVYHSGASFYYNCDVLALQRPQAPKADASVNEEVFQILGKTKSQMDSFFGLEGVYDGQFACMTYTYKDSYVWAYMDDYESGTCIGFYCPLENVVNMSGSVDIAELKQLFGDTYNDPWNGETSHNTMYKGGRLCIYQNYDDEFGKFSSQSAVNFFLEGKVAFPDLEPVWNNSNSLFYGGVTVHKLTASELVCSMEYYQLTPPNRIAETGRITLTSTDGITYTASGVMDSWGSELTITVTMLPSAAQVSFEMTKVGEMANFCFEDFIVYK